MKKTASATDPLWYKDAILYELHVRAFADSNGDGIGDFPGLLSRLDYLQDLGVTCIWLLPFFPSPLRDDGYDISNYVDVNPSYGTLADFKAVLDEAHRRDMQVMIELVINHTSDQHPWFKAARLAPAGSPEREMYVWSDSDQRYKDARIIFTDTEKSNWTWDETAHAYYWHRFFSHQPDLNFDNPRVLEEVVKAMRFWLDMGVDALRMDAIPYLVERDATNCENLAETHLVIKQIRAAIDETYANRLILAEANQWPADVRPYFGEGDECHMAFHFPLMPRIYMALRQEDRLPITDIMAQTPPIPDICQWALFLRNHDELTLEMVTDDERDYMYLAYSADPRMRVNVGIRRRLAPLVDNNRRRIELLNSLLFSFPGTPVIYYGDEIGMGDNIYLGDRNGVRTPMQWTSDRNAGFSRCDPARLYFPVIMDPIYGYQVVNVEAQLSEPSSLLNWNRNMIALRKLFQVFGRGTLKFLNPSNRKILAYLRGLDRGDGTHETVLCVANLSRFAQPVSLDLSEFAGFEPVEMLGYVPFPAVTEAPYALSLAPYSFLWLEMQPPSSAPAPPVPPAVSESVPDESAALAPGAEGWRGVATGSGRPFFEAALQAWLPHQRWFGAKSRNIRSVQVLNWAELAPASQSSGSDRRNPNDVKLAPALFFIEIEFSEGPSEIYQIPLAFSVGDAAESLLKELPQSILAKVVTSNGAVALHEAAVLEEFRQGLLTLIERNGDRPLTSVQAAATDTASALPAAAQTAQLSAENAAKTPKNDVENAQSVESQLISAATSVAPLPITAQPGEVVSPPRSDSTPRSPGAANVPRESPSAGDPAQPQGRLQARASSALQAARGSEPLPARVGSAEQSNTSILYDKQLILKLFRRLQPGDNPDVEVGRFLTEVAHFPRIAPFLGEIAVTSSTGEKTTTAMLQGLVANVGDGWRWFLDELASFFADVEGEAAPPEASQPTYVEPGDSLPAVTTHAARSLHASALLGRRTAELHLALATPTADSAFAAEPFTADDLARDAGRICTQITSTLEVLKSRLPALKDAAADDAALLLSRRIQLFARANAISSVAAAGERIRIHGDYHLGQALRTGPAIAPADDSEGDFVLLDFEGEPARPLAERRQKQSPLKDVAGMLRSLSYVAATALDERLAARPEAAENPDQAADGNLAAWAGHWQNAATGEFLRGYRNSISANPALLPPPEQAKSLLDAYVLEKALYELLYEMNNRPAWLRIPLTGILKL